MFSCASGPRTNFEHWHSRRDAKGTGFCGRDRDSKIIFLRDGTGIFRTAKYFAGTEVKKISGTGHVPSLLHPCIVDGEVCYFSGHVFCFKTYFDEHCLF